MRLSWNEIRARAAVFSDDWVDAYYEKGETQTFYNELFEVFGVKRRHVATYERYVNKINSKHHGFIDLFWPNVLLVEQKSKGRDLEAARKQAEEYCLGLNKNEFPRYILVSDFQNFELFDLDENNKVEFTLADLPRNVENLGFMIGVQKRSFEDQNPVNIEASELMGRVHDALEESGYKEHKLEQYLVRLLFCLFADDTGIFEPRDIFLRLIKERTAEDGADLGLWISQLFEVLNTPEDKRYKTLDEDLAAFPYINGALFEENLLTPSFDRKTRAILIEACEFSWDAISPAIFGSLFQSVMDKEQRRKQGAHYTTEKNIMKVIGPLFLDDLWAEFRRINAQKSQRKKTLAEFQSKLAKLKFYDPACGCGNFLIIAYRELRQLEMEVLIALREEGDYQMLAATIFSKVDVDQFYGIEIDELPVRIAEAAMWMMDHIMNNRLSLKFGHTYVRIPLKKSPHIMHADALETDWADVLPPSECDYVFGNPPFVGAKFQPEKQREQMKRITSFGNNNSGILDYVTAWFLKAGEYVQQGKIKIGFVATNSITQSEQVPQLWPLLFDKYKLEISFAHKTFAWGSDARGKAHVHVVIIGLNKRADAPTERRLFTYEDINGEPHESRHKAISPYLFDASGLKNPYLVVTKSMYPLNGMPELLSGSEAIDGGYYILSPEEKRELESNYPQAVKYIHPYVGAKDFLQGGERHLLYLAEADPNDIRDIPPLKEAVANVRNFRLGKIPAKGKPNKSRKPGMHSLRLADTPKRFNVTVVPDTPFLIVPRITSERRNYIPIGWQNPPAIPSNRLMITKANKIHFALLTSAMHMVWMRYFSGRLKSDYSYTIGIVYNTFPLPPKLPDEGKIAPFVDAVLNARAAYPDATLADLYDPDQMPVPLKKAHTALDKAVDKLYRRTPFTSETQRIEYLVDLYEKMSIPVLAKKAKKPRKKITP